jgi:4-methylaminobutanoate oxidase (formaldehyde-forming)
VPCEGQSEADLLGSAYEVEIAGERFAADASLKAMYDPKAERVRM